MKQHRQRLTKVHAIVPVNVLKLSKARLTPLLGPSERVQLSVAMLEDTLEALRKAKRLDRVTVVSADYAVRKIARSHGANWLWEGRRHGLNKAVRLGIRESKHKGASAALIIHADVPLITSREIIEFLDHAAGYSVALAPSKEGTGTNALLMQPPGVIRPLFGRDSLQKHLALADRQGVSRRVIRTRGISFDVDEPKDLRRLMHHRMSNDTGRFLREVRRRKLTNTLESSNHAFRNPIRMKV
ncbi:MAG: 2-phospho-L-lactate guanylyltransferase [Candidatus Bathyarchaeia archaeon]